MKQPYSLLFLLGYLFAFPLLLHAQDEGTPADTTRYWRYRGKIQLNFSQVGLRNWAGGGQSSISGTGLGNLVVTHQKGRHTWQNVLDVGYGTIKQGKGNAEFRKTDDRLIFSSKYSRNKILGPLDLTGLLDFRTQFTAGYRYDKDSITEQEIPVKISEFMSPGYLTAALGVEYKPSDNFFVMVSPVTGKFTFVMDDSLSAAGAYGVPKGEHMRTEFGAYLNSMYLAKLMENVTFQTRLNLFSSYKKPTAIDVNWDNLLNMQVNKYISASLSVQLIYDEDVDVQRENGTTGPAVQLKHVIAIGVGYQLKQ